MPVLWQPSVETNLHSTAEIAATYTLHVVTTQWIYPGVLFRFQVWYGVYEDATVYEFDLVIRKAIAPGTTCIVKMATSNTAIYAYSSPDVYASGGRGLPVEAFRSASSLACFAFTPTAANRWIPARGQPMFAIGFRDLDLTKETSPCKDSVPPLPLDVPIYPLADTIPGFPDQYSSGSTRWEFDYEIVFPVLAPNPFAGEPDQIDCLFMTGIKINSVQPLFATGSWSNLRDQIAQPYTVDTDNLVSPSRWVPYISNVTVNPTEFALDILPLADETTSNTGPFLLAAMPGQLAVVYFSPRIRVDPDSRGAVEPQCVKEPEYTDNGYAEVAYVVTSPLQPGQDIYFSIDAYNAIPGGFGPRKGSSVLAGFVHLQPSFVWTTGSSVIPAGTVVFLTNIGSDGDDVITITDAHAPSKDVGVIRNNRTRASSVVSIIATSQWAQYTYTTLRPWSAEMFVTAVLSDAYWGDFPPLSPMLTMPRTRLSGTNVYGRKRVIDNAGLPGTVQAALINSAEFTRVHRHGYDGDARVARWDMPAFKNMKDFAW